MTSRPERPRRGGAQGAQNQHIEDDFTGVAEATSDADVAAVVVRQRRRSVPLLSPRSRRPAIVVLEDATESFPTLDGAVHGGVRGSSWILRREDREASGSQSQPERLRGAIRSLDLAEVRQEMLASDQQPVSLAGKRCYRESPKRLRIGASHASHEPA